MKRILWGIFFCLLAVSLRAGSNVSVELTDGSVVKGEMLGIDQIGVTLEFGDSRGQQINLSQVVKISSEDGTILYQKSMPAALSATPKIADVSNGASPGNQKLRLSSPILTPVSTAIPTPQPTEIAQPVNQLPHPTRFAMGLGYPDVRLRLALACGWNVEAKAAFAQGLQGYSGRLLWDYVDFGPLALTVGGEGGVVMLDGVDSLNGNGYFGEGFVGAEYSFAQRFRLSVDAGYADMSASSQGYKYGTSDIIYNTAIYLYLF